MKYFIVFCFASFSVQAQFKFIPQSYDYSCWAASLAMVSSVVGAPDKDQCYFVKLRCKGTNQAPCGCSPSPIPDTAMFRLTAREIKGYSDTLLTSLGLNHITQLVNNKKPIIYNYQLTEGNESHIVVMDKVEKRVKLQNNKNISWIHISDPWPKDEGSRYFITYERYYAQLKTSDTYSGPEQKYTISFNTNTDSRPNADDKNYLRNILFDKNSDSLIDAFLNNIKAKPGLFSDSFYEAINFNKSLAGKTILERSFDVCNVSNEGTTIDDNMPKEITIHILLSSVNSNLKINLLTQNDAIATIISTSKITSSDNSFGFKDNWIIYHIERGDKYKYRLPTVKNRGMDFVAGNEGYIMIKTHDTYFALLKEGNDYYVLDIYGDGFNKIRGGIKDVSSSEIMNFEEFVQLLKNK